MEFDSSFFLSPIFVNTYCVLIFVFFGVCVVRLSVQSKSLGRKLREATKKLRGIEGEEGFVEHFEEYHQYVEKRFGGVWQEFVEMLIMPPLGSSDPIRNTSEVSKYLNDTTIIFPKVHLRFYHSLPNLLMGVGILGTFLGLAIGVGTADSGLASGDPNQITESLGQLLGGASLAFRSSVVGILLSLVFVLIERNVSRNLHLNLQKWVDELERHLRLVTAPSIAMEQLKELRLVAKEFHTFNTDLVFSLEKAFDNKVTGNLVPHLERLTESIEAIRVDRSTDAGHMIQQTLGQFTQAMQQQTGSQFEEMASVVKDLTHTLRDAQGGFSETQENLQSTMDTVIGTVKAVMEDNVATMTRTLQQSFGGVTEIVSNSSKEMSSHMTEATRLATEELRNTLGKLTEDLAVTSVNAATQISDSLSGLCESAEGLARSTKKSEDVLNSMTEFTSQLNSLRQTISSSHGEMVVLLRGITTAASNIQASSKDSFHILEKSSNSLEGMSMIVEKLEEYQKSATDSWAQYQERFQEIDASLARVFTQLDEGLARYCEQVMQFSTTLDKTSADAIKNLVGAVGEFNESIEELLPRLPSNSNSL